MWKSIVLVVKWKQWNAIYCSFIVHHTYFYQSGHFWGLNMRSVDYCMPNQHSHSLTPSDFHETLQVVDYIVKSPCNIIPLCTCISILQQEGLKIGKYGILLHNMLLYIHVTRLIWCLFLMNFVWNTLPHSFSSPSLMIQLHFKGFNLMIAGLFL